MYPSPFARAFIYTIMANANVNRTTRPLVHSSAAIANPKLNLMRIHRIHNETLVQLLTLFPIHSFTGFTSSWLVRILDIELALHGCSIVKLCPSFKDSLRCRIAFVFSVIALQDGCLNNIVFHLESCTKFPQVQAFLLYSCSCTHVAGGFVPTSARVYLQSASV